MKKIFIKFILILFFTFFYWFLCLNVNSSGCTYSEDWSLRDLLESCKPKEVVWWKNTTSVIFSWSLTWSWPQVGIGLDSQINYEIEGWLKEKVNSIIKNISLLVWIIAVWALVYAWFLMQTSAWDDEKIKRAKDITKWVVIGFLLLISAWGIIYIVINIMYAVWQTWI